MKSSLKVVLAVVAIVSLVSLGMAATKTNLKKAAGTVVSVDAASQAIVLKGKKADISFSTDDKTVVELGKEAKTLADIKAGDKVIISYNIVSKKNIALVINIMPAPAAKTAKSSTGATNK